jgi:FixJ family two-component response regulator
LTTTSRSAARSGDLIQSAGYTAETFASAREFLDSSPVGRTACLVLGIHLDGVNGFDLAERLASDQTAIPTILITAHDDAPTRERVRRAGVTAYLPSRSTSAPCSMQSRTPSAPGHRLRP